MLADSQKEQKLKFEVLVPVISLEKPDRGVLVQLSPGALRQRLRHPHRRRRAVANTACLGFGLERVRMALFKTTASIPQRWPSAVRARLWP